MDGTLDFTNDNWGRAFNPINNATQIHSFFVKQIMVSKVLPKNKPNSLSWKITTPRLIQKESLSSFCKKINSLL